MANKTMTNSENNAKPTFITNSPWDKTMEERDEEKKQKAKSAQERLAEYRKSLYGQLDDAAKARVDKEEAASKQKREKEKAAKAVDLAHDYDLENFNQAYEDYVKELLSVQKRAQNGEYIDKDTLTALEKKGNGVLSMAGAYEKYLDLVGDKTGFKPVDDAKGSDLKALKDGIVGSIDLTKQYSKTFGKYETPEAYMADFDDMVYGEKYDGSSYADIQDAIGKTEGREKAWLEKNAEGFMSSAELDRLIEEEKKNQKWYEKIPGLSGIFGTLGTGAVGATAATDIAEQVSQPYNRLSQLQQMRKQAEQRERWQEYQGYLNAADFEEYAKKGTSIKNPTNEEIVDYEMAMLQAANNPFADRTVLDENPVVIKNKLLYFKENPFGYDPSTVSGASTYTGYQELISEGKFEKHWDYLKPEEEQIYYYLLAKDEENGTNKADEYLEYMTPFLNQRAGEEYAQSLKNLPLIAEIPAATMTTLVTGLGNDVSGLENTLKSLSGETAEAPAVRYASQEYKSTLPKPLQYLYGAGEMIGQLAPTIALTGAMGAAGASSALIKGTSAASIFSSSFGNAYKQAVDEGYGIGQAKTYGFMVGASEAMLETLLGGVGSNLGAGEEVLIGKIKNNIANEWGRMALIGSVKFGMEAAEEEIQAFLEPYFKTIVMGEKYDAPAIEELVETFFVTLISTGILEGKSVIQEARLPSANVKEFGKRYNLDNSPETFLRALYADDSLISAKIIESVKDGDTNAAIKVLNEGIRNYKFAEEYMKYQFGKTGDLGTKISELESLKKAIAGGRFNAQAAKTALTKSSPVWEAAAGYNNTVVKGLLDGDISNKKIESTVLKNSATKAAFRRLTGIDVDAYGTLSAKRQVVKNTAEAYRTVTATPEYQEYLELAKKNETEKSTSAFTNNVKKMGDLMLSVQERLGYKGGQDTDAGKSTIPTVPQAINAVTHAAMAKAKDPLFFAGITSEVKAPSVDTETEQGSAGSTARELSFIESIESLAAEHLQGLDAKTVDMLQRASLEELLGKKGSLNEAEKKVIKGLNDQLMNADVHDKNGRKEAKEHNAKIQSQINSVKNFRRDAMTAITNEEASRFKASEKEVKDRIDYLQEFAKKRFGITIEGFDSGITYTDAKGNVLTEKEYRDAKIRGESVHRYYTRGAFEKSTGVIRIARDLANGHVTVYDSQKGMFVTKRIGNGPGMISPKNAVDIVIMHEALHQASVGEDKQLVKDIVSYIADTQKDNAYEIGNRMAGREVSKDAQDRWDALKKTYINFEMSERNISAVEAKEIVNDLYLYEEIAADYMGSLLERQDMAEVLYAERPSLWRRIINALLDFFDKLGGNGARARAAQDFANRLEALAKKNYGRSNKILPKTDTNAKARADGKTEEKDSEETEPPLTNVEEGVVNTESGEPAVAIEGDGSARASLSTYEESGRDILSEYLNERVSDTGLSERDAADILSSLDEIYNICNGMKDEYETFGAWSEAKVETDASGNPVFSVIKANGDYAMNLDFSLVCKKRRALDAVFNRLVEMGKITDFDLGQEQIVKINDIIRDHGFEVACALCFVDAKRFRQAKVADDFVTMYNSLVRSLDKNKVGIDSFNFGGDQTVSPVEDGIHTLPDSELDFTNIDKVLNGGKTGTVIYKIAQHLKDNPQDRRLVARGDFMSSEGFGEVKKRNPEILSLYNSKKGSAGPKSAFGDVQYLNDILSKKKFDVDKAYDVGGVRIQSFSDYVARLVFDYTQMVADLAAKGLPAHAYTKEVLFVKQFGLTGIKINMSLIPAIGDGRYAGLNADGSYAWAKESFPLDEAYAIQADAEYGKNCGTIAVGVSDVHIWKMLDDPAIRMVIPYHKSGINPIVAHMMNIGGFTDYTSVQNTRYRNGKKLNKADMSQVPDFNVLMHREGLNAVEASRRYVEWCEERGYLPKFHRFAYKTVNGERVFNENYYKLLEDFTTMVDGVYHPQEAVKMVFPNKDSAFGSMAELIRSGLEEDAVTAARLDADVDNIVNEIGEVLSQPVEVALKKSKGKKGEVRYSVSDTLDSDLDSILDGSFDASRNELYLGETSNFMTDVIGAKGLSLYMPAAKAYSSLVTREEYEKSPRYAEQENYHGLGKKDFIEILEKSEDPIAAFASRPDEKGNKRHNRIVLVTDKIIRDIENEKDGYAVIIEEVDSVGRNRGKTFKANKAITFYPIEKIGRELSLALADGRLLNVNKKGEHLLNMRRGSNTQATIQKGALEKNIAHFWENVKWLNAKNKKMSTGPDNLPTEMQRAMEKAGYQQQYTQNGQKGSNRGSVSEEIDEDTIQEDMQRAYDHFGTTTSFDQTGFVDGEGRMLKLSQYGLSGVNHSRIGEIYDDLKGSEAVNRFIQEGNVRIKATSPGIEIGEKAINTRQMNAISRFISGSLAKRGYFYLDITGRDGNTIASVEYDDDASAEDVLYDIKAYYERGRVPKNQTRYSVSEEMDSDGNLLTLDQAEYFADSKVRDANGNLLKVRHGTDAEFDIFDFAKSGKNGHAEGYGFYFSDDPEITSMYGSKQKEVYLDIKKPLYNRRKTVTKAEMIRLTNALIDFDLKKYADDGLTWQDSFLSNYVMTYDMSRTAAVREFVNTIWDNNDNDQELVLEVAMADGRTYGQDTMKEFYDVLTDSIGYDGIIAEWDHKDGTSNVYVTFRPDQSKYVTNKIPSGNPDMRYSVSEEMDAEYFDAMERGDEAALERIVEETARAAGYNTPRLFHGTQKFGFTDIDVSKSDDQVTVFATANEEVARTYTHHGNDPVKGERRLVSDQPIMSYEEFDALPEKELLPYVKEYLGQDFKVVPLSEATKAAREFLKTTRQRLIDLTEEKAKGLTKRNLRNRLRDAITALSEVIASKNTYTYSDAQNEYYNKLANLTREKGDVVREATKIMSQAEWAINMIPVTYEDYTYENPYEDITLLSNGKIVYDVEQARNEVKKLLFKGIYSFYGKLTNPLVVDGKGAAWSQIDGAYIGEKGKKVSTRDVALYAKEHGYDGVIYKKIIDNNVREEGLGASDVYAFFVESALKSADPVTYDNDGNVIPPSERFNPETNDIRRSVSEEIVEDEALSYEGELKEIDRKRAENEAFVSSFISTNANRGLTVTTVRDMLADTISAFDGEAKSDDIYAIKEEFDRFFEYAVDGKLHERDENGKWLPKTTKVKKPDPKKASELLDTVAEKILDVTLGLSEDRREMQDALKYLRGAKIHITQDVRNAFGDKWNEFRTKSFGTLDFRRDEGGDVSAIYEEMCTAFPELFDGTAKTVSEQLQQMYQVGEDVRLALRQGKGYTIDEKSVIQDIVTYLGQKLSEMSPETLYHYNQNLSTKEYYRNRIRKIREEYESRIKNIREHITNRSEVQEARYQKKRVEKQGKELAKRLAKPSKDKHIMVDYEADVLNLLNRITWSEQTKVNRDVGAAVKGYLAMLANRKGPEIGDPVDGVGFSESLKADIKEFKFKPLDDMDSAELHKLNELLRRATFEVNHADKLFHSNESASVAATKAIEEFQSARAIHTDKGTKELKKQWFRDLLDDSVDPETFFHNLGVQEMTDAFNRIADDQNVYANDLRTFAERMQETVGEKGVPTEWREKAIDITTARGNTIKATPAQLMSIYLLSRQEDSRKCLLSEYGGAVFSGVEQHGKVLGGVKRQTINDNVYLLTEGDLDMFEAVLTNEVPEAKAVADKISELLNTIVSEKANETSLAIEGYRKYTKSNYFPMMVFGGKSTSSTDVDVHLGKLFSSIITEGFSRDRTDNTNKKMLITDIFSVVDKHLLGVAAYHAYKADAINMNKIMYTRGDNGISLVDRISLAEGAKGSRYVRYLDNFLLAVQNGQMESNEATEFTEKAFRHYKAAAVAANMSVVAKQPISIIRALPEFSNKTALKMLLTFEGANSKTLREEMIRHSGLAQMKAWGFSENANARSFNQLYDKNAISMKERLDNATSHFAEEADMATWTRIWVACKAETKTLEEATKKFNEVIRKTQVVNTVTTASAASNRKGLAQFLFAFKNEPLKSFNYLRAAIRDAQIGKQGAGVHLFKVATSSLLNTALVAAITTMFTMFRDEEEEDMETFGKLFLKNSLNDILGNLTIFVGDVATSVYDVLTGNSQGAVERLDLAGVLDFAQDCKRIADMIGTDELDRRDTWAKAIYNLTTSFSRISGVPVGNVLRDVRGIGWSVANMTDDPMVKYKITAFWYNVYGSDNGTVKAKFRDILTDALDDGNYKGFDEVQKELRSKGFGTNEISKAVAASDTLYEAWCEGPAVLRAELAKAKPYTEILRYEDVVSSLASRKTSLVTDLYDAVRLGDKEAEEAAREALLNHRDPKTLSKLREYEVKDLLESKYNSSINEMIKDKFTGVERDGAAYNKAMSLVLAEFKHFGVTEQEVKRRIANLSIRFS